MKKNIISLVLILLTLSSCGQSDKKKNSFNENEMLKNVYEQIIKVEEEGFLKDALALQQETKDFVKEPTEVKLQNLRKQWLVLAKDWARCFAFNIGEVQKKGKFFRFISRFPINTSALEERIEKPNLEQINEQYVLAFGNDMKGLYSVEYLLFKEDIANSLKAFSSKKRLKVLELIVNELTNDIRDNKQAWDKYALKFLVNKEGKDNINNSFNQLFGGLDNVIHFAWETKVGKAIRKNDIEAPYSRKSLEIIRENIAITKKIYFEGGIADRIKFLMQGKDDLNVTVRTRYEKVEKALANIQEPLAMAVKSAEKTKLKYLLDELKALEGIELSKVELRLNLIDGMKEGDGD